MGVESGPPALRAAQAHLELDVVAVVRRFALGGRRCAVAVGGEELDGLGDDLDRLALGVVLRPFAPVEPAVDADRSALAQEAVAVLALCAPDGDAEVVGLVDPLAAAVAPAGVGGDA